VTGSLESHGRIGAGTRDVAQNHDHRGRQSRRHSYRWARRPRRQTSSISAATRDHQIQKFTAEDTLDSIVEDQRNRTLRRRHGDHQHDGTFSLQIPSKQRRRLRDASESNTERLELNLRTGFQGPRRCHLDSPIERGNTRFLNSSDGRVRKGLRFPDRLTLKNCSR